MTGPDTGYSLEFGLESEEDPAAFEERKSGTGVRGTL
jgi:hypothetical protein